MNENHNPLRPFTTRKLFFWTFGGWRWCELQRVSQHVVVIPHIQLVVSGVVVYGRYVLVRVGEGYLNRQLLSSAGVVGINHHVAAGSAIGLPFVLLKDRAHYVEHSTGHEGVACAAFIKACSPCAFESQGVRVDLKDMEDGLEQTDRQTVILHVSITGLFLLTWLTTMRPLLASVE